jgi:LytTr DNA-binding domain
MLLADPSTLIVRPLRMPGIFAVVAALALVFAAYCMLHGVVAEGSVHPAVSIAWGLSHALCWWPAWECVKRGAVLPKRWAWAAVILGILLLALALNVACGYAITVWVSPEAHPQWIEIAYQRFPIACALAIAAIALQPWRSRAIAVRASPLSVPIVSSPSSVSIGRQPVPQVEATDTTVLAPPPGPAEAPHPSPTTLRIPTRQGVARVCATEIDYVKAAGNYVEVFGRDRSWLLRATLNEIATRLDADGFVRVHRSILVNRHRVASVGRCGQRLLLAMRCGARVPVGRQYLHVAQTFVTERPSGPTAFVTEPERSSPGL